MPGSLHHVVNRAIAKRPYFETRSDKRFFLSRLAAEVRAGRVEVLAYCLMTTHFHLLVRSPAGELSEAMRRTQCEYSRKFNRLRKRDGPLIRGRFFSKRVDTDFYRRAVVRYIDVNAVRAGIVSSSAEHEFGSARSYLGGRRSPWLACRRLEADACKLSGRRRFSPATYLAAFGPRSGEDLDALCDFVESRMASARLIDPLEDLIGSTPRQVREWMRRKALLADGMEVGLPVCGVAGLRRAIDDELARGGEWVVGPAGGAWRGSELAWIALLRSLCAMPWTRVAGLTGRTVGIARKAVRFHGIAMGEDSVHALRVELVAADAIGRTLRIQRRGSSRG